MSLSPSTFASSSSGPLGGAAGPAITLKKLPVGQSPGAIALILVAIFAAIVDGILVLTDVALPPGHPAVVILSAVIVVSIAGAVALLARRSAYVGELRVFAGGFTLERAGRTETVPFSSIETLSLLEKESLNNGVRNGWIRRLAVGAGARPIRPIRIDHYAALEGAEDFDGFLETLIARAADAVQARIKAGGALRGKGFILDGAGLNVGMKGAEPLSHLAQVSMFEKKVAVFRDRETEPFFTLPDQAENARLLFELIRRQLPDRRPEAADAEGLGRVLFRKGSSKALGIVVLVLGLWMAGMGVFLFSTSRGMDQGPALILPGIGLLLVVFGAFALIGRFECHERGVLKKTLLSRRQLLYSDIKGFSYGAVRHYHNGAYMGTQVSLTFTPAEGKPLKFGARLTGNDADVDFLRDRVSAMVAARLLDEIGAGREVSWGGVALLSDHAVRFTKSRLLGKGEPVTTPISRSVSSGINEGVFFLTDPDTKAVLKIPCASYNFYPGLIVFQRLVEQSGATAAAVRL